MFENHVPNRIKGSVRNLAEAMIEMPNFDAKNSTKNLKEFFWHHFWSGVYYPRFLSRPTILSCLVKNVKLSERFIRSIIILSSFFKNQGSLFRRKNSSEMPIQIRQGSQLYLEPYRDWLSRIRTTNRSWRSAAGRGFRWGRGKKSGTGCRCWGPTSRRDRPGTGARCQRSNLQLKNCLFKGWTWQLMSLLMASFLRLRIRRTLL